MHYHKVKMMKVEDILSIDLKEDIKNVIDLDAHDEEEVKSEIDSYILTESLSDHLDDFLDIYNSNIKESGVWISGFYGSGKSYFAKMAGYLLDNPMLLGTPVRERFLHKFEGLKNAEFKVMKVRSLDKCSNRVVLFDVAKHDNSKGLPYMLFSNFMRSLGLLENKYGFIEYSLLLTGEYNEFCKRIKDETGKEWKEVRRLMTDMIRCFRKTLIGWKFSEDEYKDTLDMIQERMDSYDAYKLKEDLEQYFNINPSEKIVFLFDEVSEALTQQKIDILELEGISEALSSLGQRVWTIAIAQEKLDDVVNSATVSKTSLSKLTDRFKTKIHIDSQEVDVIIRQRLLAKTDEGSKMLKGYYDKNSGLINDVSNLSGSGLVKTQNAEMYATYYPFFCHQFDLLRYFLFGSKSLVSSKIGARGMIISTYDVLKKESVKDKELFEGVTSYSLCKQAQQQPGTELVSRYDYAQKKLREDGFKLVDGRKLLETIHFLTGAEVVKTTAENIAKSYVNTPDQFHQVSEEIRRALKELVETKTLIESNNQFRITSQTEQRIIDEMNNWEVPSYKVKGEIVKRLKVLDKIRSLAHFNEASVNYDFYCATDNDEPLINTGNKTLRIVFHDLYSLGHDLSDYLQQVKDSTQANKDIISIIPDTTHFSDIEKLITEIDQITHIENTHINATDDERIVINDFASQRGEKEILRDRLLFEAYTNSRAVYLYNVYNLSETNFAQQLSDLQQRMIDNIYTKRIKATISDSVAKSIISKPKNQLYTLFSSDEFRFFDSSGNFIGDTLSIVSEITALMKNHISGRELEEKLKEAPTGYSYGLLVCTVAALFRGNKVIARYNGTDFYSAEDTGATEIFAQAKNFGKASFKAITRSLSYNQKRDIVDCLKDLDCHKSDIKVAYTLNDFELVNTIRDFSRDMLEQIKKNIIGDEDKERLFKRSVQAREVFLRYSASVTEANYLNTAEEFMLNVDEFEKAVERVRKDIHFIDVNLRQIQQNRSLIKNIATEYKKANTVHPEFDSLRDLFDQMYTCDMVSNYKAMGETMQKIKDGYYQLIQHECEKMSTAYLDLQIKADEFLHSLEQYPEAWNRGLKMEAESLMEFAKRHQCVKVELKGDVTCHKCGLSLSEMSTAIQLVPSKHSNLMYWESSVITEDPSPKQPEKPLPDPKSGTIATSVTSLPPISVPKVCKVKAKLPQGDITVGDYRKWLKQQIQMLAQWDENDRINLEA